METRHVEVAIIGSGTAGMGAYRAVKKHTDNLVMIEAGSYGTTWESNRESNRGHP